MIVVDTNVIAYLWLPGERAASARALLSRDERGVAPPLWRSGMRNTLATLVRAGHMKLDHAVEVSRRAEEQMALSEVPVDSGEVLVLASRSGCSAYDCEFVALAIGLDVPWTHSAVLFTLSPATAADEVDTAAAAFADAVATLRAMSPIAP